MLTKFLQKKAQSLVEILLAITFLTLVVTSITLLFSQSFQSEVVKEYHLQAYLIAEEGVEAVRAIRRENFLDLTDGNHGLSPASGYWEFSGASDIVDSFYTRQVTIAGVNRDVSGEITEGTGTLDQDMKKVTVTVSWVDMSNVNRQISLAEYIGNWPPREWVQTTMDEFDNGSFNGTVSVLHTDIWRFSI